METHEHAVDELLRRVEARAALKDDLRAAVRGIAGTAAIFAAIIGIMLLMMIGAIAFASVMEIFAR